MPWPEVNLNSLYRPVRSASRAFRKAGLTRVDQVLHICMAGLCKFSLILLLTQVAVGGSAGPEEVEIKVECEFVDSGSRCSRLSHASAQLVEPSRKHLDPMAPARHSFCHEKSASGHVRPNGSNAPLRC